MGGGGLMFLPSRTLTGPTETEHAGGRPEEGQEGSLRQELARNPRGEDSRAQNKESRDKGGRWATRNQREKMQEEKETAARIPVLFCSPASSASHRPVLGPWLGRGEVHRGGGEKKPQRV